MAALRCQFIKASRVDGLFVNIAKHFHFTPVTETQKEPPGSKDETSTQKDKSKMKKGQKNEKKMNMDDFEDSFSKLMSITNKKKNSFLSTTYDKHSVSTEEKSIPQKVLLEKPPVISESYESLLNMKVGEGENIINQTLSESQEQEVPVPEKEKGTTLSPDWLESLMQLNVEAEGKEAVVNKSLIKINGPSLNIFTSDKQQPSSIRKDLSFHDVLLKESIESLQCDTVPINGFEDMIHQTIQKRLWKFPIDNEQDWDSEKDVPFHSHVFLDDALSDFPKQGPVRNYMELVTTGLSKNPYLTVEEKLEHIDWYRIYFSKPDVQEVLVESLGENAKFKV